MCDGDRQVSSVLSYCCFQTTHYLQDVEPRFGHTSLEWGRCGEETRYILLARYWERIRLETSRYLC